MNLRYKKRIHILRYISALKVIKFSQRYGSANGEVSSSGEGILARIQHACGMIVVDILHAQQLHRLKQHFADFAESDCAMVRIILFYQYVAVETTHLVDSEDTDTTE